MPPHPSMKFGSRLSYSSLVLFTTSFRKTSSFSPVLPSRLLRLASSPSSITTCRRTSSTRIMSSTSSAPWTAGDPAQAKQAAKELDIWPLDESNAALLNELHPRGYTQSCETPHEEYDLIAIGSGAGGLVSSKQVSAYSCDY